MSTTTQGQGRDRDVHGHPSGRPLAPQSRIIPPTTLPVITTPKIYGASYPEGSPEIDSTDMVKFSTGAGMALFLTLRTFGMAHLPFVNQILLGVIAVGFPKHEEQGAPVNKTALLGGYAAMSGISQLLVYDLVLGGGLSGWASATSLVNFAVAAGAAAALMLRVGPGFQARKR